ncbi:MAG: MBL fold metallo-hydrolase [Chloroflexi bacterium]|nr:MBL fold metallo-hydrolase [Chloroflexota bacterium]
MNSELNIKFWGVRGSYPTPGAGTVKYGGNTACVEINAGGRAIILDAGTGIIPLGRELVKTKRAGELLLLFSHLHHDHTQGFPFFVPAYIPNTKLHIYGPGGTPETMKHVLEHNQSSETFPISLRDMSASKDIQSVRESQVIVWDEDGVRVAESTSRLSEEAVVIRIHKSYAHPGGVYIYRITYQNKSVVYATDTEGYIGTDRRLVNFARDADVLIHDAQYSDEHYYGCLAGFPSTQGYGHSTANMAAEVAASAETGQLILFHHDPSYADEFVAAQEASAKNIFPDSRAAYEGLEVSLNPSPRFDFAQREWERGVKEVKYVKND